jgi:drug/metabolite transporter (DMT)-like permease
VWRSQSRAALGTLLLAASAVAYSSAGFFTRLIEVDAWTLLFWRGLFAGTFLFVMVAVQQRGRVIRAFRAIGLQGLLVAVACAVATMCFLNALRRTSVADVMVIDALSPFVTATIAWLLLRERASNKTLLASVVAAAGVAIMAGSVVRDGRLLGDLLAFAMVVLISLVLVLIRGMRGVNMTAAVCLSAFLCALLVSPFASPLSVNTAQLSLLALFGTSQFGLGMLLLALGTPLVSAARGALIGALQTPLGTLWVWLAFAERPAEATLVGGAVVLAAVLADMLPLGRIGAVTQPG